MKYSRNKLNMVGKDLVARPSDIIKMAEAVTIVDDWRKTHAVPLDLLVKQVTKSLSDAQIPFSFSSQRLKRMTSIVGKLERNPEMGLGGMQDIGGARFVFDSVDLLLKAKEVIAASNPAGFTLSKDIYDYVSNPKKSGYRSIHFVYKYHSSDSNLDGLSVELQIRTRLQHDWATAVETAELISKSSLKASLGDEDWLDFFKLVSAIFARKENLPIEESFKDKTEQEYCLEYAALNGKHKFFEQLSGMVGAVEMSQDTKIGSGYVVLLIQMDNNSLMYRHFPNNALDYANALYSQLESQIDRNSSAVVLVSVSDMKELKEAYPSYFLNANEFLNELMDFNDRCKVNGYI